MAQSHDTYTTPGANGQNAITALLNTIKHARSERKSTKEMKNRFAEQDKALGIGTNPAMGKRI